MTIVLTLIIIAVAGALIAKKYQTQTVLFSAGLILIAVAAASGNHEFLPKGAKTTGWVGFDVFEVIKAIMEGRMGKIGLIIMAAGGFAKYMGHIGAADALVKMAVKPLGRLSNPYVVVALAYVIGQLLNIVIPSAAGLAMLLLVSMYPILIRLGISPGSAAAVIGTTACLDLGPASGASNYGAKTIGLDAAVYFAQHQLPVAVFTIAAIAVLHFFVQRYFDRKEAADGSAALGNTEVEDAGRSRSVPAFYAIFPILPLALLLVFSKLVMGTVKLHVVTAMFISLFATLAVEAVRTRNLRGTFDDVKSFFAGMGSIFSSVVTLIFAAETFTMGLKSIGFIDALISMAKSNAFSPALMLMVLVVIIVMTAFITGSGNAAFFSFGNLAPDIAASVGAKAVTFVLPMQLASGIARSFSPVAGVIIAVAGSAGISPLTVVKRTAIPMIGGLAVMLISSFLVL